MSYHEAWSFIDRYVDRSDPGRLRIDALRSALGGLPADGVVDYAAAFDRLHTRAYRSDLWGAAYLINGGCSDDCFEYFRAWLIAMGRETYEGALGDPDSLADVAEEGAVELEEMLYLAMEAHEARAGAPLPASGVAPPALAEDWDFDDPEEMRSRYPRLFEKFGEDW